MLDYYQTAKEASMRVSGHPGLEHLHLLCKSAKKILDVGCGEGTRLNLLSPKPGWGVDINTKAITQAKKQYPKHHFQTTTGQILPFPDNSFDLIYSAFVLEHTQDPRQFISEMLRVSTNLVVFLCPNFGAPNRRSPNSTQAPVTKLLTGFLADFSSPSNLPWTHVTPKPDYSQIDDDTTVEPYLLSLLSFLRAQKLIIIEASSLWSLEPTSTSPRKLLFKTLGSLNIFPFTFWGPQLFVAARKAT